MRLLIFLLCILYTLAKKAEVKDHYLYKIANIYLKTDVDKQYHHAKRHYRTGSEGKRRYTYKATYTYNQFKCKYSEVYTSDPFPNQKELIYSQYCECCSTNDIEYPTDNQLFVKEGVFPLKFVSSESGKALALSLNIITWLFILIIPSITLLREFKDIDGVLIGINTVVTLSLAVTSSVMCSRYMNIYKSDLHDKTTSNLQTYSLYDIELSSNSAVGVYLNGMTEFFIDFCMNASNLLECAFIKQSSSLKQNILVDEDKYYSPNYDNTNDGIYSYDVSVICSIVLLFTQLIIFSIVSYPLICEKFSKKKVKYVRNRLNGDY